MRLVPELGAWGGQPAPSSANREQTDRAGTSGCCRRCHVAGACPERSSLMSAPQTVGHGVFVK